MDDEDGQVVRLTEHVRANAEYFHVGPADCRPVEFVGEVFSACYSHPERTAVVEGEHCIAYCSYLFLRFNVEKKIVHDVHDRAIL